MVKLTRALVVELVDTKDLKSLPFGECRFESGRGHQKKMEDLKKFYLGNNYNLHMYEGLIGFFMRLSHKKMEKSIKKKSNILEIGPGTHPHINYNINVLNK